jgi:hypothetical protein
MKFVLCFCAQLLLFFILIFSVSKNTFLSSGPLLSCVPVYLYVQCTILLTGHNTLRRHLHLVRLSGSPLCRRCGAEDKTSAHILCECETLALHRRVYLGSFLEPEDMKSISLGAIWNFSKVTGFP